jgi:hypothetical protein
MVKRKEEQTKKERNTQRRKRKNGWLHKGHLLWEICDFEVAAYARNPETGQIYTYRSQDGVWFPPSMEEIVSTMLGLAVGVLTQSQKLAHPPAENWLPKDFEQAGRRGQPTAKPKLNSRSNNGPPRNARNRKAAARKRVKAARYTYSLPEPPFLGLTHRGDREKAVNDDNLAKKLKQAEMAFLEGLDLNAIL